MYPPMVAGGVSMKKTACLLIALLLVLAVLPASGAVLVTIPKIPKTHVTIPNVNETASVIRIPATRLIIPDILPAAYTTRVPNTRVIIPKVNFTSQYTAKVPKNSTVAIPKINATKKATHLPYTHITIPALNPAADFHKVLLWFIKRYK